MSDFLLALSSLLIGIGLVKIIIALILRRIHRKEER
jgi:uncharacterized membrane protein